mmetsp:Transcript_15048/g.52334  ORF Transcript_15048/g.52334 Transcript_15048/m.52334 type:complete len:317 (+) Transcript_15048:706-1656(+)
MSFSTRRNCASSREMRASTSSVVLATSSASSASVRSSAAILLSISVSMRSGDFSMSIDIHLSAANRVYLCTDGSCSVTARSTSLSSTSSSVSRTSASRSLLVSRASLRISCSGSLMHLSTDSSSVAYTARSLVPPSWMNWCSHHTAVTRLNFSSCAHWRTSTPIMGRKLTRASNSAAGTFLMSSRKLLSAWYACCRISRLLSLSMSNRPSRKSGRWSSISMSGTVSRSRIQPTSTTRTYGFVPRMWSCSSGMNDSMSKSSLSVTMSLMRRSSSAAAFLTSTSTSANSLHSPMNMMSKCFRMCARATLAMLNMDSHA